MVKATAAETPQFRAEQEACAGGSGYVESLDPPDALGPLAAVVPVLPVGGVVPEFVVAALEFTTPLAVYSVQSDTYPAVTHLR